MDPGAMGTPEQHPLSKTFVRSVARPTIVFHRRRVLIVHPLQDPLVHSILLRVEETPYGSKSRGKPSTAAPSKLKPHDYLATSAQ